MKYALFILEGPKELDANDLTLTNFASSVVKAGVQSQGVEVLNASVFLCALEHGLNGLNRLFSEAEVYGLRSRTLFFDQDPSWVISKP